LDSHCYFLRLSYLYWKNSGNTIFFDQDWRASVLQIIKLWKLEQDHMRNSPYRYPELVQNIGSPVGYTGMTWTAFRPSDDRCIYHYLIPANMFVVVTLGYVEEMALTILNDTKLATDVAALREIIDEGIHKFGIVNNQKFGKVYAFEVDGLGNTQLMDDANVPSLLSGPYLGYKSSRDPDGSIMANTRRYVLSTDNPYYFAGTKAKGIGSPHIPGRMYWPMSAIMEGFTTNSEDEVKRVYKMLVETDGGRNLMHEAVSVDDGNRFTREWFGWANSLFAELTISKLDVIKTMDPDDFPKS